MPLPVEGTKKVVTITGPCGTEEALVVGGALNVNAVIAPPALKAPTVETNSQNLAVGALNYTTVAAVIKKPSFFAIRLSVPLPGASNQTITVRYISADGVAFNTIILQQDVAPGFQDEYFTFPCDMVYRAADQIQVEMTNVGLPAVTANLSVNFDP
jgi:hypothetical protein